MTKKTPAEKPGAAEALAADLPRLLLVDIPVAVAAKDLDGVYRFANAAFQSAFGLEGKTICGHRDSDFYPRLVAEEFQHQDRDVVLRGEPRTSEQNVAVGGQKRRFLWHRFPVRDAQEKIVAVGVSLVDISERMRIEAEARAVSEAAETATRELRQALAAADTRAMTDPVTGALTRRRLEEILLREMAAAGRKTAMPSLLLFELDHFGDFVARLGIAAAEAVEGELLRLVRSVLGPNHDVGRVWGGVFGVLLPETLQAEASLVAGEMVGRVASKELPRLGRTALRVGVGEYVAGETLAQWLQRVEQAMRAPLGRLVPPVPGAAKPAVAAEPAPAPKRKPPEAVFESKNVVSQPVLLAWHQTYQSGNALIDEQHRRLFDSCNALLNAMNEGRPVKQLVVLARALVDEIAQHFADEETILNESGYPGARDHARAHALLLEKAAAMSERVAAGTATSAEMFQFLVYDVVAHHLIGTDRRYFKHLRGERSQ